MVADLTVIRKAVKDNEHRFTLHALEKLIERCISPDEIREVLLDGEIIEMYPNDKYGPSFLLCGKNRQGKTLHVHCSINPIWIITAYRPEIMPHKWDASFKKRRTP